MSEKAECVSLDKGISSFEDNPSGVIEYLSPCLANISSLLTSEELETTRIFLGATAGMRLLQQDNPEAASLIMGNVSLALANSSFVYEEPGNKRLPTTRDFISQYTDGNGVTQNYQYDLQGRLTQIDIANGPTLAYSYDESGRLLQVRTGNLATQFNDYEDNLPSSFSWICDDCTDIDFQVERDGEGLQSRFMRRSALRGDARRPTAPA